MQKKPKVAPLLSSSKDKIKDNAGLLPDKPVKDPVLPPPEDPVQGRIRLEEKQEITALVEQIKSTGVVKNVFCNAYDFIRSRAKRPRLTVDAKIMLEDPLNKIEVKILEMLPEYIRKQADKGGPVIDLIAAVIMIELATSQELQGAKPREPVKDRVDPVKKEPVKDPIKPFNPIDPIPEEKDIKVDVS
jgi:hypothetical protein